MNVKLKRSKREMAIASSARRTTRKGLRRAVVFGLVVASLTGGALSFTGHDTLHAQTAPCAAPTADLGVLSELNFTVPATGEYTIWTRMIAPDTTNNSINLQVDQSACYNVGGGSFVATTWQDSAVNWVNYANGTPSTPVRLALTQGNHTLKYIGTKPGVQIDKILVTADPTSTPTGVCNDCIAGDSTPPTVNLNPIATPTNVLGDLTLAATAADASGIAKVDFLIDGQVVYTDTTQPYEFEWDSASVPNGTHELKAQATDTEGNTGPSQAITITTNNLVTCSANPSTPANVRVSGSTGTSVDLAWDASTPGEHCQIKAYRILRDGVQVRSVSGGTTTFNDSGLNPSATHSYTVVAVDLSDHASAQSTAVTGTTAADGVAPSVPANLHTSLVTANSVALAWDASTDNNAVASYAIYRNGAQVGTSPTNAYSDTAVEPDKQYSYAIAAMDAAGNASAKGQAVSAKTLAGEAAPQNKIFVSPASGSYTVGQDFTVEVRVDSNGTEVNGAQAEIAYTPNLQFVSLDETGSAYAVSPEKSGGNGRVTVVRSNTEPVTGDKLFIKITFKALAAGEAKIDMLDDSIVLSSTTYTNIVNVRGDGTYALTPPVQAPQANPPVVVTPPIPPAPTPAPAPTPPRSSTTTPRSSGSAPRPSTSTPTTPSTTSTPRSTTTVAPQGNPQPVALSNDAEVELSDPVVVQTVPESSQSTEKVEYYLNGKLIATIKEPPYTYSVDTRNLKNGNYQLTTKTYYDDGTVETKNASLVVKNPMTFKQVMLQLGGLIWVIILVLIIAAVGVWFIFFRRRNGGGGDDYSDDDGYMFGPVGPTGPADPMNMGTPPAGPTSQYISYPSTGQVATVPVTVDLSRY